MLESGDLGQKQWIKAMQGISTASAKFKSRYRIHSVVPMPKCKVKILDAADLLAWEVTKYTPTAIGLGSLPMGESLRAIRDRVQVVGGYYEREDMVGIAERNTPAFLDDMRAEFGIGRRK